MRGQLLDLHLDLVDLDKISPRNCARLLKYYLLDRKRPVISPELGIFFDMILVRGQERVDRIRQLLLSLPPRNQAIVHLTLGLLHKLFLSGANSENLAKIFGML